MGAWAIDALGNDDACDWVYGLDDCTDLSLVEDALNKVLAEGDEYLESPDACEALAAIEVIARLQGNWGEKNSYSESMDAWVEKTELVPSKELTEKAHRVIARILADDSELKELWQESEEFDEWTSSVKNLAGRVHV
ncbi:MAG: DUF4259 domain-containing protein [Burkholderiaceae bacterium]|nr:DUF4259 domain-containing protein [Burkholderiaceae bacterium]